MLATAGRAAATVIDVTVAGDELNTDADCSLREAVRAANLDQAVSGCPAGSGTDTIVLQIAQTYGLSPSSPRSSGGTSSRSWVRATTSTPGQSRCCRPRPTPRLIADLDILVDLGLDVAERPVGLQGRDGLASRRSATYSRRWQRPASPR